MTGKWKQLAGVHVLQTLVGGFGRFNQLSVGTVRDIDKADVVILAIHAAKDRLVAPREPIGAHKPRERCGLLDVIAVGDSALGLILGLH